MDNIALIGNGPGRLCVTSALSENNDPLGYHSHRAGSAMMGRWIVKLAQHLSVQMRRSLWVGVLFAALSPANAQIIEIFPDGGMATYAGPAIFLSDGIRAIAPSSIPARMSPRADPIRSAIRQAAVRHHLSESLVEAVAWQESRLQQSAVSPKGARGVMQLMPATARDLGVDPGELTANIDGGAAYLAQMMRRFDGDLVRALAAYNAGPNAVSRFRGLPPFAETQSYVDAVLDRLSAAAAPKDALREGRP